MSELEIDTNVIEIPLDDLTINIAQVRTSDVGKGINDLAQSIKIQGLLEPIVVCPAEEDGKYEIIAGQRRFLAHRELKKDTIKALIIKEPIDESRAKTLSLTENWLREGLASKDERQACLILWRRYNDINLIVEETGLPSTKIRKYLKFEELSPELQSLIDSGGVDLDAAVRAQKAVEYSGKPDEATKKEETIALAKELSGMSGAQQENVVKEAKTNPSKRIEDVLEEAKTTKKITQIVVSLGPVAHEALKTFSNAEDNSQDDAARVLIEEGLTDKGYISSED